MFLMNENHHKYFQTDANVTKKCTRKKIFLTQLSHCRFSDVYNTFFPEHFKAFENSNKKTQ